jgi:hypothetical protein
VTDECKSFHLVLKFLSSPGFPGLGFGTVLQMFRIGCQGFAEPNLFTLLNKNQTPFLRKEYLICGVKDRNDFLKCKKIAPNTP